MLSRRAGLSATAGLSCTDDALLFPVLVYLIFMLYSVIYYMRQDNKIVMSGHTWQ